MVPQYVSNDTILTWFQTIENSIYNICYVSQRLTKSFVPLGRVYTIYAPTAKTKNIIQIT